MTQPTMNPYGNGVGGDDWNQARTSQLYNYENPQGALDQVMVDRGWNPYAANPFIQSIRSMAPGMANAYLVNQVNTTQGNSGASPDSYKNFLYANMGMPTPGQAASGPSQFYAALNQAGGAGMQQAIQKARAYEAAQAQPGFGANDVNPYTQAFIERSAASNGQGATDMLGSFYSPMMGRQTRQAYQNSLDIAANNAYRSFWNQPDPNLGATTDLYTYLFGF